MSDDPENNEGQAENPNPDEEEEKKDEEDPETEQQKQQLAKFKEDIKAGLSNISQISQNTSFAYIKLSLAEKEMDKLFDPILQYQHLRYLDLSSNQLSDINIITNLRNLLSINVSKNKITSLQVFNPEADEEVLPFLQFLNVSGNQLQSLENLKLKRLRRLVVSENEIQTAENFEGHPTLEYLDMRQNKLKNLKGICNMPRLLELGAEENEITDFRDLHDLPLLRKLMLNKNKIRKILTPFPYLPSLYHVSVAENEIDKFQKQILKFAVMRTILSLSVQGNPLDVEDSKKELLMKLPYFERINDEDVTQEDRLEAEKTLKERQEEEARKKAEEEEAKRQEEEAKRLEAEAREQERLAKEAEEKQQLMEQQALLEQQKQEQLQQQQLQQQQQQEQAQGAEQGGAVQEGGADQAGGGQPGGEAGGEAQNQ